MPEFGLTTKEETVKGNINTAPVDVFASAKSTSNAEEFFGKLVAFRPLGTQTFETKVGISDATVAQILVIDEDGVGHDSGERPIFWQVVRRQLAAATPEVPWIAGTLGQVGQAYRLEELTNGESQLVRQALDGLSE